MNHKNAAIKMKYVCTIEINQPLEKVVELWSNENNFAAWQDGFQSIEHLSGEPGTKGAKSKIIFSGKQRIELTETIISVDLPHENWLYTSTSTCQTHKVLGLKR